MSKIKLLARDEIVAMTPYQSARRLEAGNGEFNSKVWLNANEASGLGSYEVSGECINRYPDFQPLSLINAYANYSQISKENLLATRGADEGIELLIRTFCRAYQDNILICPPTYGMYAISAQNHGAGIVEVPLVDCQLNVTEIIKQATKCKVIFLCSPGNPVGNLLSKTQIIEVLTAVNQNAIVVVDEAYIEFCEEQSCRDLLIEFSNLVILRTLSKAFALAGLRCGFTIASEEVITLLSKVIAPYPVPAPVADIASNALTAQGLEIMRNRVKESNNLRYSFSEWLSKQPWCSQVFLSDANFVLFRTPLKEQIFSSLRQQGLLIRDQSKQLSLTNCLRISIGSEQELNLVKAAIETITKNNNLTSNNLMAEK